MRYCLGSQFTAISSQLLFRLEQLVANVNQYQYEVLRAAEQIC